MANTEIYPYGQGGEMPEGYPLTSSLDENNSQKGASAAAAYKLKRMIGGANKVVVAAANTPADLKSAAKYVCDGTNDETELNAAIAECLNDKKELLMLRGDDYLDARTKQNNSSTDTFLLIDTTGSKGITMTGEDAFNRAIIHVSISAYEAIGSSSQCCVLAVKDTSQYGGFVELKNFKIVLPSNQKQIRAIDMQNYGGWARVHSVGLTGYTNGYDGQDVTLSGAPKVAAEGCIGLNFIGKGPNGAYGSEITNCGVIGFHEGICLNTEWTVCNHVYSIHCVYGWVFGKYTSSSIHAQCHPLVLICCGAERDVNLPLFYNSQNGLQNIDMIAFSVERNANNTPGGVLGSYATERVQGSSRGRIDFTTGQASNSVTERFWEYGHGHNMTTRNMAHAASGATSVRNGYNPNYMQRFYDETLGREVICVNEQNKTWKDGAGDVV